MLRRSVLLILVLSLTACGPTASDDAAATAAAIAEMTPMERGAILYKRCRACHTLGEGERHKVGPNLWNVFGQGAGARDDFNYSAAMSASDIIWTDETMSAYLEKPSDYIPGNRMSYAGLRKEQDRADLILYLRNKTGG